MVNDELNIITNVTVINGQSIRIRPLNSHEDSPILELWPHLSLRTRYLRFLSVMTTLPESLTRRLVSNEQAGTLAFVAEHDSGRGATVVGLANIGGIDDSSAEVGIVVRDDWQRQQIGTALARAVLCAAEQRGFRRFIGHVLDENVAIRKLLRRVGVIVATHTNGNVHEFVFVVSGSCS